MKKAKIMSKKDLVMCKCNLLLEISSKNPYPVYRNTVKMVALEIIKDLKRM
jgi:hypothetical protein